MEKSEIEKLLDEKFEDYLYCDGFVANSPDGSVTLYSLYDRFPGSENRETDNGIGLQSSHEDFKKAYPNYCMSKRGNGIEAYFIKDGDSYVPIKKSECSDCELVELYIIALHQNYPDSKKPDALSVGQVFTTMTAQND